MKRSSERILTTHVGSLPRPPDLLHAVLAKDRGEAFDETAFPALLERSVRQIVRKQLDIGLDVIDDGEFGKPGFMHYVNQRLSGFAPVRGAVPAPLRRRATTARSPSITPASPLRRRRRRRTWNASARSPTKAMRCSRPISRT